MTTNFQDVYDFHVKFGLPLATKPTLLSSEVEDFRIKRLLEEVDEFEFACSNQNLEGAADALVDLVYIAMGTAAMMGIPWEAIWDEVQRANMSKVRATRPEDSKYGTTLDIIKPDGWVAPDHRRALGLIVPFCRFCGASGFELREDGCAFCHGEA